jgi:hypothetical protein
MMSEILSEKEYIINYLKELNLEKGEYFDRWKKEGARTKGHSIGSMKYTLIERIIYFKKIANNYIICCLINTLS